VILSHFSPAIADGLIVLSQSASPGVLAWLDQVEDKAPYLMLAQVGVQVTKALDLRTTRLRTPNSRPRVGRWWQMKLSPDGPRRSTGRSRSDGGIPTEAPEPVSTAA
jgi:hypothetical protein